MAKHLDAVIDQGAVSGASFATSVIVGRFCGPDELGIYTLGWSFLPLIIGIQWSLVSLPYTYLVRKQEQQKVSAYRGHTLLLNLVIALVVLAAFGTLAVLIAVIRGEADVAIVFGALGAAAPFVMMREFVRRQFIAELEVRKAAILDTSVTILHLSGIFLLVIWRLLSPLTAIVMIGFSSGIGAIVTLYSIRGRFSLSRPDLRRDMVTDLLFGRWILIARGSTHLAFASVPWLLTVFHDSRTTGLFAATYNVVFIVSPLALAMSNMAAPIASRLAEISDQQEFRRAVSRSGWLYTTAVALPCAAIVFFADRLLSLFYGEAFYYDAVTVLLLCIAVLADAVAISPTSAILALERPALNMYANLFGFACVLATALLLIPSFNVAGAAAALAVGGSAIAAFKVVAIMSITARWG